MSLTQTGYGCWDLNAAEMLIFLIFCYLLTLFVMAICVFTCLRHNRCYCTVSSEVEVKEI